MAAWGWRWSVAVLARLLAGSTLLTSSLALKGRGRDRPTVAVGSVEPDSTLVKPALGAVLTVFCCASFASAAFTTTLVPAFVERNLPPTTAAMLGGGTGDDAAARPRAADEGIACRVTLHSC